MLVDEGQTQVLGSVDESNTVITPPESPPATPPATDETQPAPPEESESSTDAGELQKTPSGEPEKIDLKKIDFNNLSDEDLEFLYTQGLGDPKSPYHKNTAFQRMKDQRDTSKTRSEAIFETFAKSSPVAAKSYMMQEQGYSSEDADYLLKQMGVEAAAPAQPEKGFDEADFLSTLKRAGVSFDQLDPDTLASWKSTYMLNKAMLDPFKDFMQNQHVKEENSVQREHVNALKAETKEVAAWVKDTYKLEWDVVEPKLQNYLEENPKFVGSVTELFKNAFFDKVGDLEKNKATVAANKLNEEKRLMNSEQPGRTSDDVSLPPGVGKNWTTTWAYLRKKYKV